jgi:xanthine dehydrogenase accessory factor
MMRPTTWYEALNQCQQKGLGYVLITVLMSAGSTPRESGCKMVVTGDEQFDTIGGGHLEFAAVKTARELLVEGEQTQKVISYPLSSSLGQCCGGAVKLLFEAHVNHSQHLAVFGAGHVAQALVPMLAQLPVQISWIDSRENFFNRVSDSTLALSNVKTITSDDPSQEISALPSKTWIIILTHNHQLDYELVECGLKHGSLGFIGMIGSETKAKRFHTRLEHRGFDAAQRAKLCSPVGDLSIPGKRPIEVSVSICAQLIKLLHTPSLKQDTVTEAAFEPMNSEQGSNKMKAANLVTTEVQNNKHGTTK